MSTSVQKNTASSGTWRQNPKKQTKPFIMLPKYMIKSDAWRALPAGSVAAYVELACRYDGMNNGRLHLSCREQATARHCSARRAATYMNHLIEKGFVEIVRASGFNIKDRKRQATEFRLTAFRCDVTRQLPSKAFLRWRPENISRCSQLHSTVQPSAPCQKNIEEFTSTVQPSAPSRRVHGAAQCTLLEVLPKGGRRGAA
jgi:hypothetical protein